jgi:hypothetical protein
MFELRIYDRRPSSIVRYRHGGLAAIAPAAHRMVVDIAPARTGTGDAVIAPESATVLLFPAAADRTSRNKGGPRGGGRAKRRPKS